MNINPISNTSFSAKIIKNIETVSKNGDTTVKKDVDIADIEKFDGNYIFYKNGKLEQTKSKNNDIFIPLLAYAALVDIKDKNASVDLDNVKEKQRIDKGTPNTLVTCFEFEIKGEDKSKTIKYCYEKPLPDNHSSTKETPNHQTHKISYSV